MLRLQPPPPPGAASPPPPPPPGAGVAPPPPAAAPTRPTAVAQPADLSGARVLLVAASDELLAPLAIPGVSVAHLRDTAALQQAVDREPWDVIVAGPEHADSPALEMLAAVRAARPDMGLVVTINDHQPADLSTFVRARPDELVTLPLGDDALARAIGQALVLVRKRRGVHEDSMNRRAEGTPPPRLAPVHVVTGPSGGAGKTMMSMVLAHLLSAGSDRVVLADLDSQFGKVAGSLQLRPAASAYECLFDDSGRRYDRRLVAEHVPDALVDAPAGFGVLAAPPDPVHGDAITGEDVTTLVGALRRSCDAVVLDCPAGLGEKTLAALDRADHHIVVTQIDVPAIANLRSYLDTLERLGVEPTSQSVVLNKEIPASGVTGRDVEQVMGPVAGILPFEPLVARALNDGLPVTAALPDHEFTRLLHSILAPIVPGLDAAPSTGRRRAGLFRRS
ncbi:AAA family ATPase [Euzebya pacifica]|uniref:AAA family ATPase n=1 Tax=Euzebya pacifica TaxID=1608957 RepID=UPI0013E05863|nr:AAA family ATPase [Euzebya pacifica]